MVGVASLAQLFVKSADANQIARATSIGQLLAEQKMEELRSVPAGLAPSPGDTIFVNAEGYVDYFDASGMRLDDTSPAATTVPAGAVYVRRWSVQPLPAGVGDTIVLQVRVTSSRGGGRSKGRGEVRLVGLKVPAG
jgi:hypothetical protein